MKTIFTIIAAIVAVLASIGTVVIVKKRQMPSSDKSAK